MALTKKDIVTRLAEEHGLTKTKAEEVLAFFGDLIAKEVTSGEGMVLPGVGRFSVKLRPARTGRNPQTGQEMQIPELNQVKFTPAKPLREAAAAAKLAK